MTLVIAGVQLTITPVVRPDGGRRAERELQWESLMTEIGNRRRDMLYGSLAGGKIEQRGGWRG